MNEPQENLEETMRIRKAIAPILKQQQNISQVLVSIDPDLLVNEITKAIHASITQTIGEVGNSLEKRDQGILKIQTQNKEQQDTLIKTEFSSFVEKLTTTLTEAIRDLPKNLPKTVLNLPKRQEIMGKVELENVETLEKILTKQITEAVEKLQKDHVENINVILKSILGQQIKINEDNRKEPLEVKVTNQMIAEGGGGGSKNTDERVWLREEFTYTTISGRRVVSRIEKWDHASKLTIRLDYDENAKVIAKSRSLEPWIAFGE